MTTTQRRGLLWGAGAGLGWTVILLAWVFVHVLLKARAGIAAGEAMAWGIGKILTLSFPVAFAVAGIVDRIGGSTELAGVFSALLLLGVFLNWVAIGAVVGWLVSTLRKTPTD